MNYVGLPVLKHGVTKSSTRGLSTGHKTIKPVLVEVPHESGPFGAKGVGETGGLTVSAAIANAVEDALGVRIKDLPITPEKIFRALRRNL